MKTIPLELGLFALLFSASANLFAGSFTSNFNDGEPPGLVVAGSAAVAPDGGVTNSGVLKLTTTDISQTGSAVIDDLDGGVAIAAFNCQFQGPDRWSFRQPGVWFQFCLWRRVAPGFGVDGGGNGLRLVFETFDRGNGRAPTIDVWFANQLIASPQSSKPSDRHPVCRLPGSD
jgi:hypothetical protein